MNHINKLLIWSKIKIGSSNKLILTMPKLWTQADAVFAFGIFVIISFVLPYKVALLNSSVK